MKSSPHFALTHAAPDLAAGSLVRIEGAELHHMRDVMRLGPGAAVALIAAGAAEYTGRIASYGRDHATIEILGPPRQRPAAAVTLAAAIIKGPRMDFLVEKAAELGVTVFQPLVAARVVVREPGRERITRWQRLALAAAKQSQAPLAMTLAEPVTVTALAAELPRQDTLALVCVRGAPSIIATIRNRGAPAILIVCGPEGGFAPDEEARLIGAGCVAVGLSSNRLRSETAALAALSILASLRAENEAGQS